jgi:FixJ family two-component response regulator
MLPRIEISTNGNVSAADYAGGKGQVIAIVDDEDCFRQSMNAYVQSCGYVSASFASAEEYLASPFPEQTACLIADVHLPQLCGPELQEWLMANGYRIPTIFVTGFYDEKARDRVLRNGALGFLTKPCCEDMLNECIRNALKNSTSCSSARASS